MFSKIYFGQQVAEAKYVTFAFGQKQVISEKEEEKRCGNTVFLAKVGRRHPDRTKT